MSRVLRGAAAVLASALLLAGTSWSAAAAEKPAAPEPVTLTDQIAEAARSGASGAEELAASVGLPPTGPNSLTVDANGAVAATVQFAAKPSEGQLASVARIARIDRVLTFSSAVSVSVDPVRLVDLQALEGVSSVVPVIAAATGVSRRGVAPDAAIVPAMTGPLAAAPAGPLAAASAGPLAAAPAVESCRAIPVEADAPLRTDLARDAFAVDGTGVTVGIISDSFALTDDVTTPADDIALGVLPGPGNPCGHETPVRVLVEGASGDDEGRAMAQLVHGVAPGAELLFASGWDGPNGMAESIIALADAGADIIVDDLGYATETYYQQGLVSVAVNTVRAQGVAYYTSAGNANVAGASDGPSAGLPISSWQTPAFRGIACPDWVDVPEHTTAYDCLDFDPSAAQDPSELWGLNGFGVPQVLLSWAEPINGVDSAFSLQLYTDEEEPELVGASLTVDPAIPNEMLPLSDAPAEGDYRLVVVRDLTDRTPADPALWIGMFNGGDALDWREYDRTSGDDVVGPVSFGHPADGSATGVAAAEWRTPAQPEPFTSPGPGVLRFASFDPQSSDPAAALPTPEHVHAPAVTGIDGTRTSFFGGPGEGLYRFFGTSAAAPNVAAVHALAAQYAPAVGPDDVMALLRETAAPMTNPFAGILPDEDVFGAGLADGFALLDALPAQAVAGVAATALSPTSIGVEWAAGAHAPGYRVELLRQGEVVATGSLAAEATATTFADLTPDTAYRARVAALNGAGEVGPWAETGDVRTPRPPQPDVRPAAPSGSALTPETTAGLIATPDRVRAGHSVTIAGLPSSAWVAGFAFSEPTSLGWAWAGADGTATFGVPEKLPAGLHRLAVVDASGELVGWVGITVLAEEPAPVSATTRTATLARTGVDLDPAAIGALVAATLLAGAALTLVGRRRRRGAST
jgi:hypothetical protein